MGSGENVMLYLYKVETQSPDNLSEIGWIRLDLQQNSPSFLIDHCDASTHPLEDLPAEQLKIWTITKTSISITIECNGVKAGKLVYTENHGQNCDAKYGQSDVSSVKFHATLDKASKEYRMKPLTGKPRTVSWYRSIWWKGNPVVHNCVHV